jgi:hypothetical protein
MIEQHHLDMLAASGVTPEFAALRGYETITEENRSRLAEVNIVTTGRKVPGLLVPHLRPDGSTWSYQYRPDEPRLRDRKPIKYETPWQQRNGLDVPPGVGPQLGDPAVPLFITEGVKKADCGALNGLCIVALSGVWNWISTSTAGGKMALAEFRDIALDGRRVIIAFDGDVARKESVQKALHALSAYLATKGARVEYLWLPDTDDKTGLDDYLMEHTVEDLWRLVKPTKPPVTQPKKQEDKQQDRQPAAGTAGTDGTAKSEDAGTAGTAGTAKSEDGEVVLDDVAHYLARFVSFPSVHAQIAYALWIAHTWLMEAWESTPRFAFLSPEPGSGKTRALEVAEPLVPRPVHAVNCTPAYLFRKVSDADGAPTIFYDEIDTVFGPKAKDNEDIRGMLNAGHRKGAVAGRCVVRGKTVETEEIPAYCAVSLAGLQDLPDTIMTRSIVARIRRRKPDEKVEPWRARINGPQGAALGERIARWADSVRQKAGERWPEMPDSIEDRDADVWEPLLAVADLAGGRWPAVARKAAVAMVKASKARTPSLGVQLLGDVRRVFKACNTDKLPTIQLLAELIRLEESPWGVIRKGEPLDSRWLALRLKDYGVESKNHRDEYCVQFKGYAASQFVDSWTRYLPVDAGDDRDDDEDIAA